MEFYNNQDQVGGPAYILLGYWIALINGEKAMGETLFGKWVMLGWVHKLKVVYCLFGCLYTIITDFGNINEHDNAIYFADFTRGNALLRTGESPRRMLLNIVQCLKI